MYITMYQCILKILSLEYSLVYSGGYFILFAFYNIISEGTYMYKQPLPGPALPELTLLSQQQILEHMYVHI